MQVPQVRSDLCYEGLAARLGPGIDDVGDTGLDQLGKLHAAPWRPVVQVTADEQLVGDDVDVSRQERRIGQSSHDHLLTASRQRRVPCATHTRDSSRSR